MFNSLLELLEGQQEQVCSQASCYFCLLCRAVSVKEVFKAVLLNTAACCGANGTIRGN